MNLILLGPPGCGKGTQGAIVSQRTGIPRIATGDLLREAVRQGTPLGQEAQAYMDRGLLVPDQIIIGLLGEVLASPHAERGVIMDGFPRTVAQAEAVDRLLAERGRQVDRVLLFQVPDEELERRILGRAAQEGRSDDTLEALRRRLAVYRSETAPLVDFYRREEKLVEIAGVGPISEIAARVAQAIGR